MPDLTFDFKWYRHAGGYRLVPAKAIRHKSILNARPDDIQPARIVPNGGALESYQPRIDETLFEYFRDKAQSENGVLEFIKNYGPLTRDGLRKGGEVVQEIIDAAKEMSDVLRSHKVIWPLNPLNVTFVSDEERAHLKVSPKCLLDALWLQLAQAKSKGVKFRECGNEKCRKLFIAGVKGNRRGDAKFCSDKCRIEFNSLQRSRKDR
jgi:hypothetical protein